MTQRPCGHGNLEHILTPRLVRAQLLVELSLPPAPHSLPKQTPFLIASQQRSQAEVTQAWRGQASPPSHCPSSEQLPPPRGHDKNCSARRRQLLFLPNFSIPLPPSQHRDGFLPAKSLSTPTPSPLSPHRLCLLPEKRLRKKNVRVKAGI